MHVRKHVQLHVRTYACTHVYIRTTHTVRVFIQKRTMSVPQNTQYAHCAYAQHARTYSCTRTRYFQVKAINDLITQFLSSAKIFTFRVSTANLSIFEKYSIWLIGCVKPQILNYYYPADLVA